MAYRWPGLWHCQPHLQHEGLGLRWAPQADGPLVGPLARPLQTIGSAELACPEARCLGLLGRGKKAAVLSHRDLRCAAGATVGARRGYTDEEGACEARVTRLQHGYSDRKSVV